VQLASGEYIISAKRLPSAWSPPLELTSAELHSAEVSLSPKTAFIAVHTSSSLFLSVLVSSRAPNTLSELTSLMTHYLT